MQAQAPTEPRLRLSIVMPAFNEEANISRAVLQAIDIGRRYGAGYEVVVVDDGSTDRTAERAAEVRGEVRLVRHPRNLGYGAALRTCLAEARHDLIFFTDADNQFDLEEIDRLLKEIESADVAVGFRSDRRDPPVRRLAGGAWNLLMRSLFRISVRDVDCAFKLFRRPALDGIRLRAGGAMISTELMVKLGQAGRRIAQVEVSHHPRVAGAASGITPRVMARALWELVKLYPELSRLSRSTPVRSEASPPLQGRPRGRTAPEGSRPGRRSRGIARTGGGSGPAARHTEPAAPGTPNPSPSAPGWTGR
jgi:glycosyltransferase involved in cell wall biosynthesis